MSDLTYTTRSPHERDQLAMQDRQVEHDRRRPEYDTRWHPERDEVKRLSDEVRRLTKEIGSLVADKREYLDAGYLHCAEGVQGDIDLLVEKREDVEEEHMAALLDLREKQG